MNSGDMLIKAEELYEGFLGVNQAVGDPVTLLLWDALCNATLPKPADIGSYVMHQHLNTTLVEWYVRYYHAHPTVRRATLQKINDSWIEALKTYGVIYRSQEMVLAYEKEQGRHILNQPDLPYIVQEK